ncbi:MAG: radical SAM protein [Thermoprotei archaeon]|nr:radical SAM protein [Thermoprotei archaeon]
MMRKRAVYEANVILKDFRKIPLKIAICYPNEYRAGTCSLAIQILYHYLNSMEDVLAERCFYDEHVPEPRTMESGRPLTDFDVIAFSLQYEIDYVNLIRMLLRSGIPPLTRRREEGAYPLLVAGGICVIENPIPLKEFIDVFFIGEAEALIDRFVETLLSLGYNRRRGKRRVKEELSGEDGLYVPGYTEGKVRRVYVRDLNEVSYPIRQVVTLSAPKRQMPVYGRSFLLEVSRGCPYKCRFCLLGYTFKPHRYRGLNLLLDLADRGIRAIGSKKVVLISSAIGDYPQVRKLLEGLVERGLSIGLPSIRIDMLDEELAHLLRRGGQRTLTIAPEVGSEELMDIIDKGINLERVLDNCKVALKAGMKQLKLYFLFGVPGEKMKHIQDIAEMVRRIADLGYEGLRVIRLSINPMIPKPHTPFQWMPLESVKSLREKARLLLKGLGGDPRFSVSILNPKWARVQALLSRGDERLTEILIYVANRGSRLSVWNSALKAKGLLEQAHMAIDTNDELPWDFIDVSIPKHLLIKEYESIQTKLSN